MLEHQEGRKNNCKSKDMSFEKDLKRRTSATWSVANLQPHEQAMNGT